MTRFGLNHDRLVTGGQKLMKGHGDLADIVFEARSGTDVRVLVDRLDGQAAELYTPRSNSTSALIRANARREQLVGELKDTMATAEAVEAAVTRRDQAEAERKRRRLEAVHLRTEHDRLTKLIDSWPYWEKYRARRDELEQAKASGPRLSSDQFKAVTEAVARLDQIDDEISQQNQVAETSQSGAFGPRCRRGPARCPAGYRHPEQGEVRGPTRQGLASRNWAGMQRRPGSSSSSSPRTTRAVGRRRSARDPCDDRHTRRPGCGPERLGC